MSSRVRDQVATIIGRATASRRKVLELILEDPHRVLDETFEHLRRAGELLPRFRDDARRDDDFASVRDDPRFEQALR